MKKLMLFAATAWSITTAFAASSPYDFDDKDRKDMQGAWKMCAMTGFTEGDCPSTYEKCWKPPLIYHSKGHTRTYCVKEPSFTQTPSETQDAINKATSMASPPQ